MKPLKPRENDWAKFQFNVYKRVESWCKKVGIDPNNIEYAPLIKGEDTVKQPDIILNIKREPTELNFSYYLSNRPENGAMEDFVDYFIQKSEKMLYKVVIDPTMWEPNDPERWNKRIKRMREYCEVFRNDELCVACFPVVVHPYGWNQSLDHGIEDDVHVITLNHLKDFLDSIYLSTNFLEPEKWMLKIFKSKYDECPSCGNKSLIFASIFYCSTSLSKFSRSFTEETIENYTTLVETDVNKPPMEEQTLCWDCPCSAHCDGFIKTFDLICKKCGWTESSGSLHPCSLAILNQYSDDCLDCSEPHECKLYKKLKSQGVIH